MAGHNHSNEIGDYVIRRAQVRRHVNTLSVGEMENLMEGLADCKEGT